MDSSASARTRKLQKPLRAGNGGAVAAAGGGGKASWCCSFNSPPKSPESLSLSKTPHLPRKFPNSSETLAKSLATNSNNSFPNSPASSKSGLSIVGRIDPRRILSPGRVSPIDSDPCADSYHVLSPEPAPIGNVGSAPAIPTALDPSQRLNLSRVTAGVEATASSHRSGGVGGVAGGGRAFDVRLNLKGKRGACLALELSSEVLSQNSSVFAGLISDHCRNNLNSGVGVSGLPNLCRIEVPDVDNLGVFRDTIELMFEDDITRRLLKAGPYRAIDILERCKKGLDVKELEEAMGQALLTLPLKQQYSLFMKWFKHFSKHGNESPNLSKAFQIWWRRTFLRGSETHSIESR